MLHRPKKQQLEASEEFVYELRSINLFNLTPKQAESVLDGFSSFLNALPEPIELYVLQDEREVHAGGDVYSIPYKRYFIASSIRIDHLIPLIRTNFKRVPSVPRARVAKAFPKYLVDETSSLLQVFSIVNLGGTMPPGFLTQLYPLTHEIRLEVRPHELFDAKKIARGRSISMGSRIIMRQQEGRSVDPEEQVEYERSKGAAELIAAGKEGLFKVKMTLTVRAKDSDDLKEKRLKLAQLLRGTIGEMDSPRWLQEVLYDNEGPDWARGRYFFAPTSTARVFFPFAGLDVIDESGVFFGENLQTGNAIIYDVYEKENYNIAMMGTTGFGKSTLVKSLMSRMASLNDDMMLYAFDSIVTPEYAVGPDGSYENSFAGLTKCQVHRFDSQTGAGLDPFHVFGDSDLAASFIANILDLDQGEDLDNLYLTARNVSNVDELWAAAPAALKHRLDARLPPYQFLFQGEMKFYDKMVFILNDIKNREHRDAAAFLTLSAVWKIIKAEKRARKKAVLIDEGWAFVERNPSTGKPYFPMAVEYVPEIARTGRHYNACFLIATQLVADFMGRGNEYGPGRPMVESCATKIVLKQDEAASATLKEAFRLSDEEERFILNADVGKGMLITGEGRLFFYNMLSELEKTVFTTAPKEVRS